MSKTGDKNRRAQRKKGFFSEAAQAVKEGFQSGKDKAKAAADERRAERSADDATTKEAVSETAQERYDGYRIMIENDSTMSEAEKAETLAMFRRLWGIPEPESEAEPKDDLKGDSEPAADESKDQPKSEPEPKVEESKAAPKDEAETKAKSEGETQTKGGDSAAAKAAPKQEPKVEPKTEPKTQPKTGPKAEPAKVQPAADGAIWKIGDGLKIGSVFYVHDFEHGGEYPVVDRWAAKAVDPEYTPVRAWFKNGRYVRDLNLAELRHYFGV